MEDIQRNAYQLTINNPAIYGYTHEKISQIITSEFLTLRYFCMADEIGEQGTPHTHIYIYLDSRVRWSKIKKAFPEAHIEAAKGSPQSNLDYIKKTGKWTETNKAETSVEGSFEEFGSFPKQKGHKQDLEELYELVKNGYSNAEILAMNNDYILQIDKLDKLRTIFLIEKYKNTRRLGLKVIYIEGPTGTGKTRHVLDQHGDANVYRVADYKHPFDNYSCQPVLCFDEFRSQLPISDMLNYLDIYPLELPARYSNKYACYDFVYIISNWSIYEQYSAIQHEQPTTWAAFLRRINKIIVYNADGSIQTYCSPEEYLSEWLRNQQRFTLEKLNPPAASNVISDEEFNKIMPNNHK